VARPSRQTVARAGPPLRRGRVALRDGFRGLHVLGDIGDRVIQGADPVAKRHQRRRRQHVEHMLAQRRLVLALGAPGQAQSRFGQGRVDHATVTG